MKSITKIALSLSLITLIAQSAPDTNVKQMPEAKQAATYTDHAKKAGKVLGYIAATGVGLTFLGLTGWCIKILPSYARELAGTSWAWQNTVHEDRVFLLETNIATGAIASFALLYFGIKGLKNELSKKTEHAA